MYISYWYKYTAFFYYAFKNRSPINYSNINKRETPANRYTY